MASIYVSDVMDQCAATIEIQGWLEHVGPPEVVWQKTCIWPGVGETDPVRWTARALNECLSEMKTDPHKGGCEGLPVDGPHTLSGTGDMSQRMMG